MLIAICSAGQKCQYTTGWLYNETCMSAPVSSSSLIFTRYSGWFRLREVFCFQVLCSAVSLSDPILPGQLSQNAAACQEVIEILDAFARSHSGGEGGEDRIYSLLMEDMFDMNSVGGWRREEWICGRCVVHGIIKEDIFPWLVARKMEQGAFFLLDSTPNV